MEKLQGSTENTNRVNRLLVGVSGSVAVLGIQSYLAAFRSLLADEIRVIMTDAAAKILPPSTVALFSDGVFTEESLSTERTPGHVELARWAEMFVAIPATANLIGQAAHGIAPNLLTSTILASPRPVIFCPNANDTMWRKKVVQRNLRILQDDGHHLVPPTLTEAYEVASGAMRENWVVPDPVNVVGQIKELHGFVNPATVRAS